MVLTHRYGPTRLPDIVVGRLLISIAITITNSWPIKGGLAKSFNEITTFSYDLIFLCQIHIFRLRLSVAMLMNFDFVDFWVVLCLLRGDNSYFQINILGCGHNLLLSCKCFAQFQTCCPSKGAAVMTDIVHKCSVGSGAQFSSKLIQQ